VYKVLVEKPEGKGPLGTPWHSWGIMFKWIKNRMGKCGMDSFGSG
jgi:hypothetical protein